MIKIAYSKIYEHNLPLGHRFPMSKYPTIKSKLIKDGIFSEINFFEPIDIGFEAIQLTHTNAYIKKLQTNSLTKLEERKIGFPFSQDLLKREINLANGTVQASKEALQNGVSFNIAGGTHHAFADKGEGFCIFNDIAVAINYLINKKLIKRALIIDLDVHQGNGTANIFENNSDVFTFSMHGAKNYPFKKENSDLDIGVEDGINDEAYLELLESAIEQIYVLAKPDIVLYQSGVDILSSDKLGKLNVSMKGIYQRDQLVFKSANHYSTPICTVMGGGYSPNLDDIVNAHCQSYMAAKEVYQFK